MAYWLVLRLIILTYKIDMIGGVLFGLVNLIVG